MLEDLSRVSSLPTNACLAENINVHFCCLANHDLYLPILTLTAEGDNIWQYKPPTIPTGCCGTCNVEGPIPSRGRDRDSKIGPRFGIEIMHGYETPKITIGITGWRQNLSRDVGIEEPYNLK